MILVEPNNRYVAEDGSGVVLAREYVGTTPNGSEIFGDWVLRDSNGRYVESGAYRLDIAEGNDLELLLPEGK
jgi:hypothetical protein